MLLSKTARFLALLIAACSLGALHLPAQDAPSVAEAARRTREQKQSSAKPATVITDDTLHPAASAPSAQVPGDAASAPSPEKTAANGAPESQAKKSPEETDDAEKKKAELEALKRQIKDKKESVNLLQRELTLEQANFYRNPDYAHDRTGKEKLDSMQFDLDQQKAGLEALKAKFADLGGVEEPAPAPGQAPPQS